MHVLHATDGSEPATEAGDLIVAMADRAEVDVLVLSVVPTGRPTVKHLPNALRSEQDRRDHAERVAAAASQRLRDEGFTVDSATPEGRPSQVIASTANERGVGMLVVGAGPKSPIVGRVLGSVTTALLHGPTPLLVVREAPSAGRVGVVVATDGSPHADRAVALAASFLDPERCDVTVVSVAVLITATPAAPYGGYATSAPNEETERDVVRPAWERVEKAAATMRARGFQPRTKVVMGHPVKRLVSIFDSSDAALLVVGSRGTGYSGQVVLGSVSDQMVRMVPACLIGR
jgi:nucleotide-binding universal stress UspA family protein